MATCYLHQELTAETAATSGAIERRPPTKPDFIKYLSYLLLVMLLGWKLRVGLAENKDNYRRLYDKVTCEPRDQDPLWPQRVYEYNSR